MEAWTASYQRLQQRPLTSSLVAEGLCGCRRAPALAAPLWGSVVLSMVIRSRERPQYVGAGSREGEGREGTLLGHDGQSMRLLCPRLHKLFTNLPPFSIEISSPVVATGRGRPASRLFPALAGLAQPTPVDAKTICIGWKAKRLEFARRAQARPSGGSAGRQHALRAQPLRQAAYQRSRQSTLHACDRRQNGGAEPHVWGAAEGPRGRQPRRFHQGKFASGARSAAAAAPAAAAQPPLLPLYEEQRLPGCVALTCCQRGDTRACRQRGDTRACRQRPGWVPAATLHRQKRSCVPLSPPPSTDFQQGGAAALQRQDCVECAEQ